VGLEEAVNRLNYHKVKNIGPKSSLQTTLQELYWELENLRRAIERGLRGKLFVFIPNHKAAHYGKADLFGAEVQAKSLKLTRK
jgi:hypothetical protein